MSKIIDPNGLIYTLVDGYLITGINPEPTEYINRNALQESIEYSIIKIPEKYDSYTVKKIGPSSFRNSTITKAIIPNTVQEIGQDAFAYCNNLIKVIFQPISSLLKMNQGAIYSCPLLKQIELLPLLNTMDRWALGQNNLQDVYYCGMSTFSENLFNDALENPHPPQRVHVRLFYEADYFGNFTGISKDQTCKSSSNSIIHHNCYRSKLSVFCFVFIK